MTLKDKIGQSLNISRLSGVPVFFLSNPGVGKTTLVKHYAKINGYEVTELIGSTSSPEDILGYEVNEGKESLTPKYPSWAVQIWNDDKVGKKHILFVDEITTTNPGVQASLLKLVFDRKVKEIPLPDSTLIVSAGNYASNLNSNFGLISPILNRFCEINLNPTIEEVAGYVSGNIDNGDDKKHVYPENIATLSDKEDKRINKEVTDLLHSLLNTYGVHAKKSKEDRNNSSDFYLDLNNKDYTSVDNATDEIYGIMTLRTISYLSRMTKAAIQLGYKDVPFIPLGLIGFGTGTFKDYSSLEGYHNRLLKQYKAILNSSDNTAEITELADDATKSLKQLKDTFNSQPELLAKDTAFSKIEKMSSDEIMNYVKDVEVASLSFTNKFINLMTTSQSRTITENKIISKPLEEIAELNVLINNFLCSPLGYPSITNKNGSDKLLIDKEIIVKYRPHFRNIVRNIEVFINNLKSQDFSEVKLGYRIDQWINRLSSDFNHYKEQSGLQ